MAFARKRLVDRMTEVTQLNFAVSSGRLSRSVCFLEFRFSQFERNGLWILSSLAGLRPLYMNFILSEIQKKHTHINMKTGQ